MWRWFILKKSLAQIIKKGLLVFISLLVALALCEAGLWLLGIEYPSFYDFDPALGYKLKPGMKGYWLKEGGGYVSINSDGLRDREHPLKKSPNTLRIAILGDSFAEAMQVNQEETFWAVMENELQKCGDLGGRQVEVINFGQSGFGTTLELLVLRHRVWKYNPDVVLLAFVTSNDVAENYKPLAIQWGSLNEVHPYHVYRNGELVLDDKATKEFYAQRLEESRRPQTILSSFFNRLKNSSRIYQLFRQLNLSLEVNQGKPVPPEIVFGMYHEPTDELWKNAWKITEDVLTLMNKEITQKGAQFFVVVLTSAAQVHPDAKIRKNNAHYLKIDDLFYPDYRIEKFCKSQDIPVLLLAPSFQRYADAQKVHLHGFKKTFRYGGELGNGHWNQAGHRLGGQTIAEWLCGQLK
jgi:hypothetical protein